MKHATPAYESSMIETIFIGKCAARSRIFSISDKHLEIYNNNKFIQRIVTSVSLPQVQIIRLQERKNIHNDIKVNYLKNTNKFHTNKNNNGN